MDADVEKKISWKKKSFLYFLYCSAIVLKVPILAFCDAIRGTETSLISGTYWLGVGAATHLKVNLILSSKTKLNPNQSSQHRNEIFVLRGDILRWWRVNIWMSDLIMDFEEAYINMYVQSQKIILSASEGFTVHIFQRQASQYLGAEISSFHSKWQETLPLFQPLIPPPSPFLAKPLNAYHYNSPGERGEAAVTQSPPCSGPTEPHQCANHVCRAVYLKHTQWAGLIHIHRGRKAYVNKRRSNAYHLKRPTISRTKVISLTHLISYMHAHTLPLPPQWHIQPCHIKRGDCLSCRGFFLSPPTHPDLAHCQNWL